MPNYSMNTGLKEQPRPCQMLGTNNVGQYTAGINSTMDTVPYDQPKPISDASVHNSGTKVLPIGETAHDITMGSRNGN